MDGITEKLERSRGLSRDEYVRLIDYFKSLHGALLPSGAIDDEILNQLFSKATALRKKIYGNSVYMRGLIEFSNHCKNDCYYCGIRRSNSNAVRYRLDRAQILECCKNGYELGFRTFVLQSGEDPYYDDDILIDIVSAIRKEYPDCAITLSLGERSRTSYELLFGAGADRYLLRHETADADHYRRLHPAEMSLTHRKKCLFELKEIGYQVGCGFMVGSPFQTAENLADDLLFIEELQPQMVGIGPFIPHKDTPFASEPNDEESKLLVTLGLLSVIRLIHPSVLLPATTALGTIHPLGRELGINAGANVVMPNLSPATERKKYMLYDGKICTGDEAAECRSCMGRRMESIGYSLEVNRGDYLCTI